VLDTATPPIAIHFTPQSISITRAIPFHVETHKSKSFIINNMGAWIDV
jgi:hypothetical protein